MARSSNTPSRALASTTLVLLALGLTGCNGALWGNMMVLGVTVGIFFGTLALGRSAPPTGSASASASTSTGPRA